MPEDNYETEFCALWHAVLTHADDETLEKISTAARNTLRRIKSLEEKAPEVVH